MRPETFYTIGNNPTAGSSNTIMTVPTGYEARVTKVFVTNNTGSTKTFSAAWVHGSDTYNFASSKSLNSKDFIEYFGEFGQFLIMDEGDTLTVTPEAASTFVVLVSFILLKHDGTKFDLTI
jgi:hypothetical protein